MSSGQRGFDVVRRGYDVEQVEQFLMVQAEAWSGELELARTRMAAMEEELRRLSEFEAEAEDVRRRAGAINKEREEAASAHDELLYQASQEVMRLRTEAERDIAKQLQNTEIERARIEVEARKRADQLTKDTERDRAEAGRAASDAQAEVSRIRSGAETKAMRVLNDARAEAERVAANGRSEAASQGEKVFERQEIRLNNRRRELDEAYIRTKSQYDRVIVAMSAKVAELKSTHQALVTGLQAIAKGGLSQIPGDDLALPTSVGENVEAIAPSHDQVTSRLDLQGRTPAVKPEAKTDQPKADHGRTETSLAAASDATPVHPRTVDSIAGDKNREPAAAETKPATGNKTSPSNETSGTRVTATSRDAATSRSSNVTAAGGSSSATAGDASDNDSGSAALATDGDTATTDDNASTGGGGGGTGAETPKATGTSGDTDGTRAEIPNASGTSGDADGTGATDTSRNDDVTDTDTDTARDLNTSTAGEARPAEDSAAANHATTVDDDTTDAPPPADASAGSGMQDRGDADRPLARFAPPSGERSDNDLSAGPRFNAVRGGRPPSLLSPTLADLPGPQPAGLTGSHAPTAEVPVARPEAEGPKTNDGTAARTAPTSA